MKRWSILGLVLLICVSPSFAQSGAGFAIERGGKLAAHLFPIAHVSWGRSLPEEAQRALETSDSLVTELGLFQFLQDGREEASIMAGLVGETRLNVLLGQELFDSLIEVSGASDMARQEIVRMHPFFAATIPVANRCKVRDETDLSYEALAVRAAGARGLPVMALETVEQQLGAMPPLDPKLWRPYVANVLRFASREDCGDALRESVSMLRTAVAHGDLAEIGRAVERSRRNFDDSMIDQYFTVDRNAYFAARMDEIMAHHKPVFLIGGAHLIGEQGVIALLKKRGYSIHKE